MNVPLRVSGSGRRRNKEIIIKKKGVRRDFVSLRELQAD